MELPWGYFGTLRASAGLDGVLTTRGFGCAMMVILLPGQVCCAGGTRLLVSGGRMMVNSFTGFSCTGADGVVFLRRTRRLVSKWSSPSASIMIESYCYSMSPKDVGYGCTVAVVLGLSIGVGARCSVVGDGGSLGGVFSTGVGAGAGTSIGVLVGGKRWWSMEANVFMEED